MDWHSAGLIFTCILERCSAHLSWLYIMKLHLEILRRQDSLTLLLLLQSLLPLPLPLLLLINIVVITSDLGKLANCRTLLSRGASVHVVVAIPTRVCDSVAIKFTCQDHCSPVVIENWTPLTGWYIVRSEMFKHWTIIYCCWVSAAVSLSAGQKKD